MLTALKMPELTAAEREDLIAFHHPHLADAPDRDLMLAFWHNYEYNRMRGFVDGDPFDAFPKRFSNERLREIIEYFDHRVNRD